MFTTPMPNLIPVFYTPKMVADSESASPSAAKPAQVVESWLKQFPIAVLEQAPVTTAELERAHDPMFVADVLTCRRSNGFGNKSAAVAASLPYTSGSMLSAARHVLQHGGAAAAPCSGFHHAGYDHVEGYCTFNGLMVTALALKEEGLVKKVAILDLDMHYGNGTDNIIRRKNADWIEHFTAGATYMFPSHAQVFFKHLPEIIATRMLDCDIVLYQAGADPHIDDPNGGWLTTEELHMRDALVFDAFSEARIPIAWNLAGGYQIEEDGSIPKVLEIHDNTMRECVRVYG
jgi:acetoin utilization deacetylase AcuC-like enzyme